MAVQAKQKRNSVPAAATGGSLISDAKLRQLYAKMLQCRLLDEASRLRHKRGGLPGRFVSSAGRVAVRVGAAIDLRRDDWVAAPAGDFMASFLKGLPLAAILSRPSDGGDPEIVHGRSAKSSFAPMNIFPPAATLPAQLDLAAGVALGGKARKNGGAVMLFGGRRLTSGKQVGEALDYAAAHRLPLVVLFDGTPSIKGGSAKGKGDAPANIFHRAGVPVIPVDGEDVVAIYRVAYESIHKARHGGGPTLIEAVSGSGADPIARMEDYLAAKGLFSAIWKQRLVRQFEQKLDQAATRRD